MSLQILTIGENPNLAFYAWRLHATKSCFVTMVSLCVELLAPIRWESPLEGSVFTPNILLPSLSHIDQSKKFDIILLSVANLQSFQSVCAQLEPLLHQSSIIAVESTGYVQLEPFVLSNFPRAKGLTVCSVMNESEVKKLPGTNTYSHSVLNGDLRIYLGTCTDESKSLNRVSQSELYSKLYKLLQRVQADLHSHISLLKSNNYKEFMTYQWKLALPRIVLNPLSVVFEEPFPENLGKQILAKPLITGLVNELFKIIKKMECKLIKGFENEASISKNWLAHYPITQEPLNPPYLNANPTFYNMHYGFDMELDLLLLQPILLGDDHDVRTPYLENLYSIMSQIQTWGNLSNSVFFTRKIPGTELSRNDIKSLNKQLSALRVEKEETENSHRERLSLLKQLDANIRQKREAHDQLSKDLQEKSHLDINLRQLSEERALKQNELRELDSALAERHQRLAEIEHKMAQAANTRRTGNLPLPARDNHQRGDVEESAPAPIDKDGKIQALQTPDMSDLSDIAVYGAALNEVATPRVPSNSSHQTTVHQPQNGPHSTIQPNGPQNAQNLNGPAQNGPDPNSVTNQNENPQLSALELKEKELELKRRERALLDRERSISAGSHPSMNDMYNDYDQNGNMHPQNYNQMNYQQNGYRPTYSLTGNNPYNDNSHDGYNNGYGPNNMPANRNQRYNQGQQFNQMPQPSRRGSQGNMQMNYQQQMNYSQQMPQMPMNHQMMNQQMPQQMRYNGQPPMPNGKPQGQGSQQYGMNQAAQGNMGGFPPKKPNRRSTFPDQLNIDYGGRGGMAMTNAAPKGRNGNHTSPILPQQRKSTLGVPQATHANGNHLLRPPAQTGSSNSLGSGHNTPNSTTPEPHNEIRLEVPPASAGTPLGAIAPETDATKKKKRGFLKKN